MQTQIKLNIGKQGEDFTNMYIVDAIIIMKKKTLTTRKFRIARKNCEDLAKEMSSLRFYEDVCEDLVRTFPRYNLTST